MTAVGSAGSAAVAAGTSQNTKEAAAVVFDESPVCIPSYYNSQQGAWSPFYKKVVKGPYPQNPNIEKLCFGFQILADNTRMPEGANKDLLTSITITPSSLVQLFNQAWEVFQQSLDKTIIMAGRNIQEFPGIESAFVDILRVLLDDPKQKGQLETTITLLRASLLVKNIFKHVGKFPELGHISECERIFCNTPQLAYCLLYHPNQLCFPQLGKETPSNQHFKTVLGALIKDPLKVPAALEFAFKAIHSVATDRTNKQHLLNLICENTLHSANLMKQFRFVNHDLRETDRAIKNLQRAQEILNTQDASPKQPSNQAEITKIEGELKALLPKQLEVLNLKFVALQQTQQMISAQIKLQDLEIDTSQKLHAIKADPKKLKESPLTQSIMKHQTEIQAAIEAVAAAQDKFRAAAATFPHQQLVNQAYRLIAFSGINIKEIPLHLPVEPEKGSRLELLTKAVFRVSSVKMDLLVNYRTAPKAAETATAAAGTK